MSEREIEIGDDVPYAHSVMATRCDDPACTNVHLVLLDEQSQPIATCVVAPEWLREIIPKEKPDVH